MERADPPASRRAEATRLLERAPAAPQEVIASAAAVAASAAADGDPASAAVALRAGGLAYLISAEPQEALDWLGRAMHHAIEAGDPSIVGGVEMTSAAAHAWAGNGATALVTIDRAVQRLVGIERVRAQVQRGTLRYRMGDLAGAIRDFDRSEAPLLEVGDVAWLARLHGNRGIVLVMVGRIRQAERDLVASVGYFERNGQPAAAAQSLQNLGWLHSRSGDFPTALQALDDAEARLGALGQPLGELWGDRADVLLAANLIADGKRYAQLAAAQLAESGMAVGHAEALLRVAFASMLDHDLDQAADAASRAVAALEEQGRPAWAAYGSYLLIVSRSSVGDLEARHVGEVRHVAERLEQAGFLAESVRARALVAELELAEGNRRSAHRHLAKLAELRSHPSFELRIAAWVAEAHLRLSRGDRRGADAAARAGLRVVEAWQATMGGAELRAMVSGHAAELARIGLDLAHASNRAARVFRWMERTRAGALRFAPVRPPDDAELAGELTALREAEVQFRRSRLDGDVDHALEAQVHRLRRDIRRRSQRRHADGAGAVRGAPAPADVRQALARTETAALVEIGMSNGELVAVVVTPHGSRLRRLGTMAEVREALDDLRFALQRSSSPRGSRASQALAHATASTASHELDELLLGPLGLEAGPIVIVPPAELHAVPWGMFPSRRGTAVIVAPSAGLWISRSGPAQRSRRGVVVANGPDLPGAAAETRRVAQLYSKTQRFTARTSTADALLTALDGSRLAHLVAHGTFRADNPLFSSLRFADGGITVYDLERVDRMPPIVVLSACNSGLQAARPGNETMGFVAALLSAGCRTVIASTGLVPDTAKTARTMEDFHRRLLGRQRPATALAGAQAASVGAGNHIGAAASFVCFGTG